MTPEAMLDVAYEEARKGLAEGGIPIGAALFSADGELLGSGHNMRVQLDDPSIHGETSAFRNAGRQTDYRSTIMATTPTMIETITKPAALSCGTFMSIGPPTQKR